MKRAMHQKYLQYIKAQENAIAKEIDYISDTLNAIKRYKLIRHKYLNFEIGNPRFINLQVTMNSHVNIVIIN